MATAAIAPLVTGEILESGVTLLPDTDKGERIVPSPAGERQGEKIPVEFTQSTTLMVRFVAEVPSARPDSVLFGALVNPKLRLRKAIPLEVSVEEGQVVLSWNETGEFACGSSMSEALDDFSKTLSELYTELNSPDVLLGTDLQRVRHILDDYIEPRHK
jgi:hypothetical protein